MISRRHTSSDGITVFCGSSPGKGDQYMRAATSLGQAIAASGKKLVYGGGTKGLMGRVASSCLEAGGPVHGIIPRAFLKNEAPGRASPENLHPLEQETTCNSMHERKKMMSDESGAFVVLPGGYGTAEEAFEMITWSQLNIHCKPVVLLSVGGFYSSLRHWVETSITEGFIAEENRAFMIFVEDDGSQDFNWGEAALRAIADWHKQGSGGAKALELDWPEDKRSDLT